MADSANHPAEKGIKAALIGIGSNLFLAVVKMAAGVFGNSYALIADAIESATDVFSSLVVWAGLKVSTRPPDENHPQGHGKAEPMAATLLGLLLLMAAVTVAWQSIQEILIPHTPPAPWTLVVLVIVVLLKATLSRFVHNVAEETGSVAVKGDAWHHLSDALTSGAAFIGILIALVGNYFMPHPRWASADDWAALLTSGFIAFNAFSVLRSSVYELSDAHPSKELEMKIREVASRVQGVVNLHKCFVRKMGFDYFVELDVRVDPEISVKKGHDIAHSVQDAVRKELHPLRFGRVMVHIEPAG